MSGLLNMNYLCSVLTGSAWFPVAPIFPIVCFNKYVVKVEGINYHALFICLSVALHKGRGLCITKAEISQHKLPYKSKSLASVI